ncbi:hypothetical protein M0802_003484 [Mischocyttarus mexicanus]|nr:hypothetical protein M0802_003484 [Mischocyttarus mexicanus]
MEDSSSRVLEGQILLEAADERVVNEESLISVKTVMPNYLIEKIAKSGAFTNTMDLIIVAYHPLGFLTLEYRSARLAYANV